MTNGHDMQGADIRAVVLLVVDEELPRQRQRPDGELIRSGWSI
jgi:hypothetical protein